MVGIFVASAGPLGEVEFVKCPPPGGVAHAGNLKMVRPSLPSFLVPTVKPLIKKCKSVKLKVKSTFKALTCTITVGGYTSGFSGRSCTATAMSSFSLGWLEQIDYQIK